MRHTWGNNDRVIMGHALDIIALAFVLGVCGWLAYRSLQKSHDPPRLIAKWVITLVLVGGFVYINRDVFGGKHGDALSFWIGFVGPLLIVAILLWAMWSQSLLDALLKPFTGAFFGGDEPPEPRPCYSIANARRKFGDYRGAIEAIKSELARFPDDFEGYLLWGSILAEDLHDLPAAEAALMNFCLGEDRPPAQVAAALNQIADWYAQLGHDYEKAAAYLKQICERFPGSSYAILAQQRLAHIKTRLEHKTESAPRKIQVPHYCDYLFLEEDKAKLLQPPGEKPPEQLATEYQKHLEEYPNDMEVREKLASLYALHLHRMDLAQQQIDYLLQLGGNSPALASKWLNLLADWQLINGADYNTVRQTLEQIIDMYPDSPVAAQARNRIDRLAFQIRAREKPGTIALHQPGPNPPGHSDKHSQ